MKSIVLFDNIKIIGILPYKNYNCSIIKLNKNETFNITNKNYNEESILITLFVSSPSKRYGTMSWIGIMSYEKILQLLDNKENNNDLWLIKQHLLQNDKGPKCADLRIFKMKNNIGVIGYTRVAPNSNTIGIADYYVRVSILDTQINNKLYEKPIKLFDFNEIDGGCFPSKIGNDYKKFEIENDECKINNIEFYIKDNNNSKIITPHESKNKLMQNNMKLNGIEVSFSKISTNEDSETHISTKNIIPLQHINYLDNIGCFVDFSSPKSNNPIITIQNMINGKVYHTDKILIDSDFIFQKYRGSTPFIEIENKLWVTLVHKRVQSNTHIYNINYNYILLILDSKTTTINENEITLPNKVIKKIQLDMSDFNIDFIYITGLIINKQKCIKNKLELELMISYGISDKKSGISLYNLITYLE